MSEPFVIRNLSEADFDGVVALQKLAFPPPFDEAMLWQVENLEAHLRRFPEAQWVAIADGRVVGSCSNVRVGEAAYLEHGPWNALIGGTELDNHDPEGSTLYGLDISVHPNARRQGLGRAFYQRRFAFVQEHGLTRYATACRIPDFSAQGAGLSPAEYAERVARGELVDRTLTPMLRFGMTYRGVVENYMDDAESGHAAARLEWKP